MTDSTYGYDDFSVNDNDGNNSDVGMQGFKGCSKYPSDGPPAVTIKSGGEFRFFPAVDPENKTLLPPVKDGKLTFLDFEAGVDYCGLKYGDGDSSTYRQINMWVTPSDIADIFPDERASIGSDNKWKEFAIKNSPYKMFKQAMVNSKKDSKAPPEWNDMCFRKSFKKLMDRLEGGSSSVYSAAVPDPDLHAVAMGGLRKASTKKKDKDYEEKNKKGLLYPAIFEFNKSASKFIRSAELVEQANEDFESDPNDEFKMEYLTSPKQGRVLEAKTTQVGEDNYYKTLIKVPSARKTVQFDPVDIVRNWYPLREEVEVEWTDDEGDHAEVRSPIINLLTAEEQIEWLIWAFGPIPVDYAFEGTVYHEHTPDNIKGLFEQFTEEYNIPDVGDWWELRRRDVLQGKSRTTDDGTSRDEEFSEDDFNSGDSADSANESSSDGDDYSYDYSANASDATNEDANTNEAAEEKKVDLDEEDADYDKEKADALKQQLKEKGYGSE